jgi:hypothetical protein
MPDKPGNLAEPRTGRGDGDDPAERDNGVAEPHERAQASGVNEGGGESASPERSKAKAHGVLVGVLDAVQLDDRLGATDVVVGRG